MPPKRNSKSEPSALLKKYLFFYNLIQLIGWSYIAYLFVTFYINQEYRKGKLWNYVFIPVVTFQVAAILEIIHVAVGFVKTSIMITTMQILFRILNAFGVFNLLPANIDTIAVPMTLFAWCGAEITRYAFHIFKELNFVPYVVTWLRYSAFIVLIPIGVGGELLGQYMIQSLYANKWTYKIPNVNITVGYRHFIILIMLVTLQGVVTMYRHLFQQRKKALGGAPSTTRVKSK
ncbi:very-long-chain (3R)-3-hydroxyacyl-CoA dehydratase 2-like [Planococcus citri]|uniref:very-long-chain (3R)-3-hydroxyacyl-CoA dehydratase 2-like n=1 Tax=Planococcus citri TaxID=170843 RepID=UPI0031F75626